MCMFRGGINLGLVSRDTLTTMIVKEIGGVRSICLVLTGGASGLLEKHTEGVIVWDGVVRYQLGEASTITNLFMLTDLSMNCCLL